MNLDRIYNNPIYQECRSFYFVLSNELKLTQDATYWNMSRDTANKIWESLGWGYTFNLTYQVNRDEKNEQVLYVFGLPVHIVNGENICNAIAGDNNECP